MRVFGLVLTPILGMTAARYLHIYFTRQVSIHQSKKNKTGTIVDLAPSSETGSSSHNNRRRDPLAVSDVGSKTDWCIWIFSVTLFWVTVWILANAIPVFSSLLNISAALLLSWFTWGVTVLFWFDLNKQGKWRSSGKKLATAAFNVFIMCVTLFMVGPGMYASIDALMVTFATTKVNGAFTCADNSIL
jgi:hypothetical protein